MFKALLLKYYFWQWQEPKRFLCKGFGFTFQKWCMVYFPVWNICLGNNPMRFISYDIFHNGVGFSIHLPPILIIDLCTSGKMGWWEKMGLFRIRIKNWEWKY